jgi:hypothetical protein
VIDQPEEPHVIRDASRHHADIDRTGARRQRVSVLRDLVMKRAYDVPAEDVAASIIRDAIVVATPAMPQPH